MVKTVEVIIVGAGLAGLCCARRFAENGLDFLLLEASNDVGDRVTGYCSIRRFTKFDAIRDSGRWPEINAKVKPWVEEATADGR